MTLDPIITSLIETDLYKINMWQYSDEGNVDGISGKVDMNISFVEY